MLRSSGSSPITVKFYFQQRQTVSKRRSTALRNARNENTRIKEELRKKSTLAAKWKKKFITTKNQRIGKARKKPEAEGRNIMTPNSKTKEIRSAGISPKQLPNPIVKQLQFKNCLLEEIKDARKENKTQTDSRSIDRIISGSTIKKYKCSSMLSNALSINRKRLINSLSKRIRKPRQSRLLAMRNLLREQVESFLERDDISRCMPGKNDSIKVGNEKRQTRILNHYLRNVYEKFIIENKDTKISFSSFCKLRPNNIKKTSLLSRNTCTIHQNICLKLKSLRSLAVDVSPNPETTKRTVTVNDFAEMLKKIETKDVEFEQWKRVEIDGKKRIECR